MRTSTFAERRDLLDQVVRHRGLQRRPAHEHRHAAGELGEVHGRLPGRVRAADHDDVLVLARARLGQRGAVVDPGAGELREAGRVELAVGDARGDEHAVGAERAAAAELHDPPGALDAQRDRVLDGQQLGPEPARLVGAAAGEVGAAEAGREAEVVLDPARLAGLAAGRLALDHHRPQALRGAVDGGRQPGRAAADDHEVVVVRGRRAGHPEPLRELEHARALEHLAVLHQRHRQPVGAPRRRPRAARAPRRRARRRASARARGCGRGSRAGRASPWRSGARRSARRRPPAPRPPPRWSAGPRRRGTAAPRAGPRA